MAKWIRTRIGSAERGRALGDHTVGTDVLTDHAPVFDYELAEHSVAVARSPQFDVSSPGRRQLRRETGKPHRLDTVRQGHTLRARIDDETACWL